MMIPRRRSWTSLGRETLSYVSSRPVGSTFDFSVRQQPVAASKDYEGALGFKLKSLAREGKGGSSYKVKGK